MLLGRYICINILLIFFLFNVTFVDKKLDKSKKKSNRSRNSRYKREHEKKTYYFSRDSNPYYITVMMFKKITKYLIIRQKLC